MEGGRAFRRPKTLKALETRKPGTDQAGESSLGIPIPRRLLCLASAPTTLLSLSSHPPFPSQDSEQCSFRNRRLPRAFLPGAEPGHGNHWPCDDPFPRHGKAWAILPCCAEGSLADFVCSRQCPDTRPDATRWANALAVLDNTDPGNSVLIRRRTEQAFLAATEVCVRQSPGHRGAMRAHGHHRCSTRHSSKNVSHVQSAFWGSAHLFAHF